MNRVFQSTTFFSNRFYIRRTSYLHGRYYDDVNSFFFYPETLFRVETLVQNPRADQILLRLGTLYRSFFKICFPKLCRVVIICQFRETRNRFFSYLVGTPEIKTLQT